MLTPPMVRWPGGSTLGHSRGVDPFHCCPTNWRMKLIPTAVISGASLGARRRRRYARNSIVTLIVAQKIIARTSTSTKPSQPLPLETDRPRPLSVNALKTLPGMDKVDREPYRSGGQDESGSRPARDGSGAQSQLRSPDRRCGCRQGALLADRRGGLAPRPGKLLRCGAPSTRHTGPYATGF